MIVVVCFVRMLFKSINLLQKYTFDPIFANYFRKIKGLLKTCESRVLSVVKDEFDVADFDVGCKQ